MDASHKCEHALVRADMSDAGENLLDISPHTFNGGRSTKEDSL